jgi:hypothetical protein
MLETLKLPIKATLQLLITKEMGHVNLRFPALEHSNLQVVGSAVLLPLMVPTRTNMVVF